MLTTSPSSVTCLKRRGRRNISDDAAVHGEALDLDERRNAGGRCPRSRSSALAIDDDRGNVSTLNASQLDVAVETLGEGRHHELRSGSVREAAAATIVSDDQRRRVRPMAAHRSGFEHIQSLRRSGEL